MADTEGDVDVDIRTINEHLINIYSQGEVDKDTTIRKSRIVQKEGNYL